MPTPQPALTKPLPTTQPALTQPLPTPQPAVTQPLPTPHPDLTQPLPTLQPALNQPFLPTHKPALTQTLTYPSASPYTQPLYLPSDSLYSTLTYPSASLHLPLTHFLLIPYLAPLSVNYLLHLTNTFLTPYLPLTHPSPYLPSLPRPLFTPDSSATLTPADVFTSSLLTHYCTIPLVTPTYPLPNLYSLPVTPYTPFTVPILPLLSWSENLITRLYKSSTLLRCVINIMYLLFIWHGT